jgi:hypothetical protein
MRGRCVLGTLAVFGAGTYAGMWFAASAARSAGCPAATDPSRARAAGRARGKEAGDRLADAAEQVVSNLEALRQRRCTAEPSKDDIGGERP